MESRAFYDRSVFWVMFGGATAVIGSIPLAIVIPQISSDPNHPEFWKNAWFDFGLGAVAIGLICLFWALVLFLAHGHAAKHWCPDPGAHTLTQIAVAPDQNAPQFRSVLRAMRNELRGAARKIESSIRNGKYWPSSDTPTPTKAWKRNREQLMGMSNMNTLLDALEDAYGQIWRVEGLRNRSVFSRSRVQDDADLEQALATVQGALTAVEARLAAIDGEGMRR